MLIPEWGWIMGALGLCYLLLLHWSLSHCAFSCDWLDIMNCRNASETKAHPRGGKGGEGVLYQENEFKHAFFPWDQHSTDFSWCLSDTIVIEAGRFYYYRSQRTNLRESQSRSFLREYFPACKLFYCLQQLSYNCSGTPQPPTSPSHHHHHLRFFFLKTYTLMYTYTLQFLP